MWLLMLVALMIVGLALFGLIAAFVALAVAIVAYLLPVLLIVAGVWLLAKALVGSGDHRRAPRERRAERRGADRPAPSPVMPRPARQRPTERRPASPARRELPIDVQVKAEQIRHKVDVLLGYADRFPPFSRDLYIVRQTAADYLPRTLSAYLAIPGTNDPPLDATGRTALDELRAQLAILDASVDEITQNLQRRDLDGMLANRRFLEERFGPPGGTPHLTPVHRSDDVPGRGADTRSA
jgi:hypothetical protein